MEISQGSNQGCPSVPQGRLLSFKDTSLTAQLKSCFVSQDQTPGS
jgi:hypothetical protein